MIDNNKDNLDDKIACSNAVNLKEESSESTSNINNIIDLKNDQIIKLELQLSQLKEHERDTVLRLQAEIENIRRRNIQEIEKAHKFALERFVAELLPVIDNLERALGMVDRTNNSFSMIVEGIDLTLKSFLDTVYKFGVESIHEIHVPFNPEIHQAISTIESKECQANQVLTIIQKGYLLNGRLIRPAMVTVSKSKC
ncbi:protein grpE [Candidatus Blochmanniella vafra str. BVAF]|uniref:Protein GrpE n=1 Tax=Blochmanniella vafra (strain BVAF) TaxID=859654 RepID=E8Q6F9_BLOVB|nr:nucleotide exchange factor GrpE [Candidatus Blochmannia vafer]ADV33928.1 protein grpE [Candidatus Blochmannia vafer str. BVAF]